MARIQVFLAILFTVFVLSIAQTNAARTHTTEATPWKYCVVACAKAGDCSKYCIENGFPGGGACGTGKFPMCCCSAE
ncbi:hypothetical protein AMTRI_Chr07g75660 [Amborella trichopoda]